VVDHLGLMEAGVVVRYALAHGVAEVRWGTSTVWGRRVLGLLGLVRRGVGVTQVALNPAVILFDAEGQSKGAVYETLQQASLAVADAVAARMEAGRAFVARLPFHVDERRRRSFLRTSIIAEIYRPLLAGLTASAALNANAAGANAVVLVPGGIAGELNRATSDWTPGVRYVGVPSVREGLMVRSGWFALAQLRRVAKGLSGGRGTTAPSRARVGLMSNWGVTGDGPPRDVWWFAATGLAPERCAVLFGRSKLESGQVADSAAWLRANGYGVRSMPGAPDAGAGWVDATPGVLTTLRDLLTLGTGLRLALGSPGGRWQAALLLRTAFHARAWVEVFRREGIRVWFDAAETSPDYAALACDAVGGIKLGLFWASTVTPIARAASAHHVRFVPGPAAWTAFEALPGGADVGLEVGNTYQSADEVGRDRAAGIPLRASLVSGADDAFVMTLLDRSAGPVNILPTMALLEFYEAAIAYAESDARVRLVVKPKKPLDQTLIEAPALLARVRALESAGRAVALGYLRSPLEAAFASDVALALGVSSAGFLTALAGVPTVFCDPTRAADGPYGAMLEAVGWKRGATAFDTTADAFVAIEAWRADRVIVLGDLGAGARLVDPYADGDSAGRVSMFVRAYVDAMDAGAPRAAALESASAGFATAHGVDRVRCLGA
jgi:hypothetical protein